MQDVPDKFDLGSMAYPFRISDVKETMFLPGTTSLKDTDMLTTQKVIKVKSYYSCGINRAKKITEKNGVKQVDETVGADNVPDGTETWISFADFCKTYR